MYCKKCGCKNEDMANFCKKWAELEPRLGKLQRECRELGIPVMIAFEGYGASGKGVQISELIRALDPRGRGQLFLERTDRTIRVRKLAFLRLLVEPVMLPRTDTEYAPWNIVEAVDRRFATVSRISRGNDALSQYHLATR